MIWHSMTRRELIAEIGAFLIAGRERQAVSPPPPRLVPTVMGPLGAHRLGLTLMHEHLLVDFIGARAATTRIRLSASSFPTLRRPGPQGVKRSSIARRRISAATSGC